MASGPAGAVAPTVAPVAGQGLTPFGFTNEPVAAMAPQPAATRSGIPRVIGILMIIFGSLGALAGLVSLLRNESYDNVAGLGARFKALKHLHTLNNVSSITGLLIGIYELVAGGRAVQYRGSAPSMATWFAIANIATTLLVLVLLYAWIAPSLSGVDGLRAASSTVSETFFGGISIVWSVVVLALMTRPAAKAACETGL